MGFLSGLLKPLADKVLDNVVDKTIEDSNLSEDQAAEFKEQADAAVDLTVDTWGQMIDSTPKVLTSILSGAATGDPITGAVSGLKTYSSAMTGIQSDFLNRAVALGTSYGIPVTVNGQPVLAGLDPNQSIIQTSASQKEIPYADNGNSWIGVSLVIVAIIILILLAA